MLVKYRKKVLRLADMLHRKLGDATLSSRGGGGITPFGYVISSNHMRTVADEYSDREIRRDTLLCYNDAWKRLKQMEDKPC